MILSLTSDKYDVTKLYDLSVDRAGTEAVADSGSGPGLRRRRRHALGARGGQSHQAGQLRAHAGQRAIGSKPAELACSPAARSPTTANTEDIITNDQISQADDYKPLIVGYHNGTGGSPFRCRRRGGLHPKHPHRRLHGRQCSRWSSSSSASRAPTLSRPSIASTRNCRFWRRCFRKAYHFTIALDRTTTIRASVHDVEKTLLISDRAWWCWSSSFFCAARAPRLFPPWPSRCR